MRRIRKVLAILLTFVFVISVAAAGARTEVYAAATDSLTMYVGEEFSYSLYTTTIKSVSSSDKSIVKVSKDDDLKFAINLTAKKAGSAKVTIKYKDINDKSKTTTLKVTVKKADITCKVTGLVNGYALIKIKNNTKQTFERAYIKYNLKDSDGDTVKSEEDVYVTDLVAGKTAYYKILVGKDADIKFSKCTASVTALSHDPGYTYKVCAKDAIEITAKNETENDSSVSFTIKIKNTTKQQVDGKYYLLICDAEDDIIGIEDYSIYLGKKETKTNSYTTSIYKSTYPTYDHYKFVVNAYYTQKNK